MLDGQDTHALNQQAFNLPSRLIAKIYLFRTIFNWGKGYAFTVDPDFMQVSTSVEFWDNVGKQFYGKYKSIDKLYHINLDLIKLGKPIVGPLGRQWNITMGRDAQGNLKLPYTLCVNYQVQGTGADVMMIARISFFNRLKKAGLLKEVKLVSTVHDSIVVDCPSKYVPIVGKLFHEVFADLQMNIKRLFNYDWVVPLECEVKYGPNMKDMKELKMA